MMNYYLSFSTLGYLFLFTIWSNTGLANVLLKILFLLLGIYGSYILLLNLGYIVRL